MTKHERLILEMLTENPMLSQADLASELGLTRSSVSVYISRLMQKGYIRGRGYLLENQDTLYVIGSVGIDYRTVLDDSFELSPQKPAFLEDYELTVSYGGIAKNISENLHHLGHHISCISAIGSDVLGTELINDCKRNGLDVNDMLIVPASKSSTFLEVRSLDLKRVIISSCYMKLQSRITPEFLSAKHHKLRHSHCIVLEDGLSSETLQYISSNYSHTILVCSKPGRFRLYAAFLNQFRGLVAQLETAWYILGEIGPVPTDDASVFSISRRLRKKIDGPVLLCYGDNQFCYISDQKAIICSYSNFASSTMVYTHYRDTVAAGFIHCLLDGIEDEDLLRYVCACRNIVCEGFNFVNDKICPDLVDQKISQSTFSFRTNLHP